MELISHHQAEEFWKCQKVTPCVQPPPRILLMVSILAEKCMSHQEGLWVRMIGQRQPENNPITVKPKTASHVAEQFSWVPLHYCSLPGRTFPIKFLALWARVSLGNSFLSVRKDPTFGPWKGVPLPATVASYGIFFALGEIFCYSTWTLVVEWAWFLCSM